MKGIYTTILLSVLFYTVEAQKAQTSLIEIRQDLYESEKYTFGFLNKLLNYWQLIYTDTIQTTENKILIYKKQISSQSLENNERIQTIISNYITKQQNQISYIYLDSGKHEVFIKFPIKYKGSNKNLSVNFIRVKSNKTNFWKISDLYMSDTVKCSNIGLNEVEFEKDFSNFISEISKKNNIAKYFNINPSFQFFLENYSSILATNKSFNISLTYRITELPYCNKKRDIIGYKFLIIVKDIECNKSKKHGWHILDEGDMNEYYRLYDKNNIINFYLKQESNFTQ